MLLYVAHLTIYLFSWQYSPTALVIQMGPTVERHPSEKSLFIDSFIYLFI